MSGGGHTRRSVTHVVMGGLAFTLFYLSWPAALLLALVALFINAEVLPHTQWGSRLWREGERPGRGGIVMYPFAVAVMVLVFRDDSLPAAGGWAAMAFGDGCAGLIGRRFRGAPLRWSPEKSWGGLVAFVVGGGLAIALVFLQHGIAPGTALGLALVAAVAGAVLESLPVRFPDDNLRVAWGVALVILLLPRPA